MIPDWDLAACRQPDVDPELFVASGDRGLARTRRINKAKAICSRCPICRECGLWATRERRSGIYGGTTDTERDAIRKVARRAAA